MRKPHYHVYVVELADPVWNAARFRRANPGYQLGKPFVYVGMTGIDPDVRFDKHKAGIQSNSFVRVHGVRLLPALYEKYNPMPYEAAREMEVELGIRLRRAGWGVWQA
jgi:predicted GIY-YIG superfamily endonuclease